MGMTLVGNQINTAFTKKNTTRVSKHNLTHTEVGTSHIIHKIDTIDNSIKDFLFTLGCFEGEIVTVVSILADIYVINVKDARYSIDKELASAILI